MSYAIDHQRFQSINISATSDPENLKELISKLLYIRKEVAIAILKCNDDIKSKEINEMYNRINYDLLTILGIVL